MDQTEISQCILSFSCHDTWWDKFMPGYTHVNIFVPLDEEDENGEQVYVCIDPLFKKPRIKKALLPHRLFRKILKSSTPTAILFVDYVPTSCPIIRPIQTCATLVQYIMGTNLGAITPNALYTKLITNHTNWLSKKGIKGVSECVIQEQELLLLQRPSEHMDKPKATKTKENKPSSTVLPWPTKEDRMMRSKKTLTPNSPNPEKEPPSA